ncbi:MAG: ribosome small subunit-dependent GTPase A [Chlamydiales bacterium]|nr:ribosome small subunit-dependent GTPase A [Chlamydiales bacterium]
MSKRPLEDSYLDEDEFFTNRREVKKLKKIKSKKDRSKFKKSNLEKEEENPADDEETLQLPLGRVIKIQASAYHVYFEDEEWLCSLKGKIKKERFLDKNLVVVGDWVYFEKLPNFEGVIVKPSKRTTFLSRSDNLNQRQQHIIAANVDQILITTSVVDPILQPFLIDRYLISANKGNLSPVILINKLDLLDDENYPEEEREKERALLEHVQATYQNLGIPIYCLNKGDPNYTDSISKILHGKTSVFSGKSGVGKTSLINIIADLNMKVKDTVRRTKKGSHTTTTTSLIPLNGGGFCIDTPGIKSFGIWDLEASEISEHFTEIQDASRLCKFQNCRHLTEPECNVKKEVENGSISHIRYESYQQIIKTAEEKHLRR